MRRARVVSAAIVAVLAAAVVAVQPLGSPWWVNADPDGAYVGSGINLLLGNHTVYLDHPGLANEEALALLFGGKYVIERVAGRTPDLQAFADDQLLHLDGARWLYRGFGVVLLVLGGLVAAACVGWLLGSRVWGAAGGALFVTAPAVGPIAIMTRPDVAAAACAIAIACLVAAAFERRDARLYLAAAFLLGFALTTKLVVFGLLAPLVLAAFWRGPEAGWADTSRRWARAWIGRHRLVASLVPALWVALCVVFNWGRPALALTSEQRNLIGGAAALICGYAACAFFAARFDVPGVRAVFRPVVAVGAFALVAGFAVPALLVVDDAPATALSIWNTTTGRGLSSSVEPFADFAPSALLYYPLLGTTLVVACAVAAAVVGAIRGTYWPTVLALGSVLLAVEAAARLDVPYYYASAYVVAIPGALWLFATTLRSVGAVAALAVVAYLLQGALTHPGPAPTRELAFNAAAQRLADRLVGPDEVILTPYWSTWPIEDVRYDGLVVDFTSYAPVHPYRFVEGGGRRLETTRKRIAYYATDAGTAAQIADAGFVVVGDRRYDVRGPVVPWGGDLQLAVVRVTGVHPE